jgi:hypothetical protein
MVDFVLYGGLPSLNFTLVVDLEIWGFLAPSLGCLGFWYIGISATTLGRRCTLFLMSIFKLYREHLSSLCMLGYGAFLANRVGRVASVIWGVFFLLPLYSGRFAWAFLQLYFWGIRYSVISGVCHSHGACWIAAILGEKFDMHCLCWRRRIRV